MLAQRSGGFTLIEVLVATVVLVIGLLGVAGMQLVSFQNNQSAYLRTQATFIAAEFIDRMRANASGHRAAVYDAIDIDSIDDVPPDQLCINSTAGCSASQLANQDIREWAANFWNVYAVADYKPTLPQGRAVVARDTANNEYRVTVFWQERGWSTEDGNIARADAIERYVQLRTVLR